MTVCYDNMQARNPTLRNTPNSILEFIMKPQLNMAFGTFEVSLTETLLALTLEEFMACLNHFQYCNPVISHPLVSLLFPPPSPWDGSSGAIAINLQLGRHNFLCY